MTMHNVNTAPAAEREAIVEIPLADLHDSPLQPRIDYRGIEGLAESIKAEGRIHQALLVRPRVGPLFEGDLAAAAGYEVVFGHRRKRAAALAGLATAPCTVRVMTDQEVRSAQMVENVQRENMTALEEGAGFKAQIDAGDATADELAQRIGKSRSFVYGRIKLLDLSPPLRAALNGGEVGTEVALLLARLRTDKLQQKALQKIAARNQKITDGGQESYRRIRELLAEEFTLQLKTAIFPINDATLLAGAGACGDCPKRAGNAPEYEDLANDTKRARHEWRPVGGADACTDPDCWAAKKAAHLQREAEKLRQAGAVVIDGNKARNAISATGEVKSDFVPLKAAKALKLPKDGVINGLAVPQPVVIQNPRDGSTIKAYRREDLVNAGVLKAEPKAPAKRKDKAQDHQAREQARRDEERRREVQARAETEQHMALLRQVREVAAGRQRDAFDLRLVAAAALAGVGHSDKPTLAELWNVKDAEKLVKRLDTMTPAELTTLLLDCAIVHDVRVPHWAAGERKPVPLMALAEHYGIDVKAALCPPAPTADPAPTPSTAGAGAKKATAADGRGAAVAYRCAATGSTWSGRGKRPAWVEAALAAGQTLDELRVATGAKAEKVKVDAGGAGDEHATASGVEEEAEA